MAVGVTSELNVDYMKPSFTRSFKAMYVTTAGDVENKEFNDTFSFIRDNFNIRDHTQKEIWLMGLEFPSGKNTEERYIMNFATLQFCIQYVSCNHV